MVLAQQFHRIAWRRVLSEFTYALLSGCHNGPYVIGLPKAMLFEVGPIAAALTSAVTRTPDVHATVADSSLWLGADLSGQSAEVRCWGSSRRGGADHHVSE